MKLERKALMHFLDTKFAPGGTSPEWYLIGKDIEDMSVELNPDTETTKNILGETSVKDNGYEPELEVDPYYANPDEPIYAKLKDIAMNRLKGDSCRTKLLELIVEDTDDTEHDGWVEEVIVKPTSYGGDTAGVAIPYTIQFDGNRRQAKFRLVDKKPVEVTP